MKQTPFAKILSPFRQCTKCGGTPADPDTGFCRKCEIEELIKTQKSGRSYVPKA